MCVRRITILLFLFIFGIVNQAWAENLRENKGLKLMESMDGLFPLYKMIEGTWRYPFLVHQGAEETKSLHSDLSPSIPEFGPKSDSSIKEGGAKAIFEFLQSKTKRTEIFISFHLSFDPKGDQMFLGMKLTPSSDKGVNFLIPFSSNPTQ